MADGCASPPESPPSSAPRRLLFASRVRFRLQRVTLWYRRTRPASRNDVGSTATRRRGRPPCGPRAARRSTPRRPRRRRPGRRAQPGPRVPSRGSRRTAPAVEVAARSASRGVRPWSTSSSSSRAFCPCGKTPMSLPFAIVTPSARAKPKALRFATTRRVVRPPAADPLERFVGGERRDVGHAVLREQAKPPASSVAVLDRAHAGAARLAACPRPSSRAPRPGRRRPRRRARSARARRGRTSVAVRRPARSGSRRTP